MSGRPTKPGYYWLKHHGHWDPCDVRDDGWDDGMSVMPLGRDYHIPLDHGDLDGCEWGPRLLPPDNNWTDVLQALCEANAEITKFEADACIRERAREKELEAATNGVSLSLKAIVIALGGKPGPETNLVWILKRIEELRG